MGLPEISHVKPPGGPKTLLEVFYLGLRSSQYIHKIKIEFLSNHLIAEMVSATRPLVEDE